MKLYCSVCVECTWSTHMECSHGVLTWSIYQIHCTFVQMLTYHIYSLQTTLCDRYKQLKATTYPYSKLVISFYPSWLSFYYALMVCYRFRLHFYSYLLMVFKQASLCRIQYLLSHIHTGHHFHLITKPHTFFCDLSNFCCKSAYDSIIS